MYRLLGTLMGVASRRRQGEASGTQQHSIPFHVLRQATNKFHDRNVIGTGGFGKVYRGVLQDGTKVAVKRRNKDSQQGTAQFQVEMQLLLRLTHPNFVSLIGYCDEKDEMILVYKYMEEGTLTSHLYGPAGRPSLSWKQRLEICVGAAKGLHCLHTASPNGVIHRDVKPDNILLDENLCAKIGDFGLSKDGPWLNQTHISTQVMGTPGYIDPQYYETGQLTMMSDVYSFGVVLLEVLCARPVIVHGLSAEKVDLVRWGKKMLEAEQVEEIVDENILGTIDPHYLVMFGNIVLKCMAKESAERPTMEEVLRDLECELDRCILTEEEVAAGGRALQRSHGKNYDRYSSVSHHAGLRPIDKPRRQPMNGEDDVELESIIEDENSYYI